METTKFLPRVIDQHDDETAIAIHPNSVRNRDSGEMWERPMLTVVKKDNGRIDFLIFTDCVPGPDGGYITSRADNGPVLTVEHGEVPDEDKPPEQSLRWFALRWFVYNRGGPRFERLLDIARGVIETQDGAFALIDMLMEHDDVPQGFKDYLGRYL